MNSRKKNSVMKVVKILCLAILVLLGCVPPTEEEYHEINIDYKDEGLRHILDLQVRQELDSLLILTGDPNPTYRLYAAKAFASFQAAEAYDSLIALLKDPFIEVKTAAAFALGQLGNTAATTSLVKAFSQQDSFDVNNTFNGAVLEAIGKLGSEQYLKSIATVNTYRTSDTLLLKGQSNAIYQYGLRDMIDPEGDKTMFKLLSGNYPLEVKKMAAQYFYRFEEANLDEYKFQALKIMKEHADPDIRMALATALTRKGYVDLRSEILAFYNAEKDYRVKCNILRQLHSYPYISVVEQVLKELSNENAKVGLCAADYLLDNGNSYDAPVYREYLKNDQNPYVQIKVHQAILRNSGRNSGSRYASTAALKDFIDSNAENNYIKAAAILALSEDSRNYQYLIDFYDSSSPPILSTRTVEGLVNIVASKSYVSNAMKQSIADFFQRVLQKGQNGAIAAAAEAFQDKDLDLLSLYENSDFLTEALKRLVLPNELETYNILSSIIAEVQGQGKPGQKVSDNIKAINWELFDQYGPTPEIRISTNKGEIVIELFKHQAPQGVMNMIELVKTGFYNNKYFHRVIPNFVAQAGCPDGDGYGSLNYTIRSELNNVHFSEEGYLGYASAGLHTESTQWYITYSPTPHLNGKYTIFGKVINGMDVVHKIEVGDKINRIAVSN